MNTLTSINPIFLSFIGAIVGGVCAYVGSLMVLKRMSLVGDALTHVALPGMAIAISLQISPILGAFVALTIAVFGIWYLEEKSSIYPEALVGIFFTASLAIGALLTSELELIEALFGSLEKLTLQEGLITIIISLLTFAITSFLYKKIVVSIISPDLAKASGINTRAINLLYLLIVGTVVSIGIRFVGTLLMGALVIIPAASAKNLSKSMRGYLLLSILFGLLSTSSGVFVALEKNLPVGPIVVLVSVIFYIFSFAFKRN